jgi:hypothetical protein
MGARKGKLAIEFASVDELERIVGVIAAGLGGDRRGTAIGGKVGGQGLAMREIAVRLLDRDVRSRHADEDDPSHRRPRVGAHEGGTAQQASEHAGRRCREVQAQEQRNVAARLTQMEVKRPAGGCHRPIDLDTRGGK